MTKVVFACKSNSCRSQMAEGWAREWIRKRREDVNSEIEKDPSDTFYGVEGESKSVIIDLDNFPDDTKRRRANLNKVTVVSAALDSLSVFEQTTINDDFSKNQMQRKCVKQKAVAALAGDGIDISHFFPKTVDEIFTLLYDYSVDNKISPDSSDSSEEEKKRSLSRVNEFPSSFEVNNPSHNIQKNDDIKSKIIDKLIILCSCGDEMKKILVSHSKNVEEWEIDAPTAAANAGEGEEAYFRVSHEIRDKVNFLMENLVGR